MAILYGPISTATISSDTVPLLQTLRRLFAVYSFLLEGCVPMFTYLAVGSLDHQVLRAGVWSHLEHECLLCGHSLCVSLRVNVGVRVSTAHTHVLFSVVGIRILQMSTYMGDPQHERDHPCLYINSGRARFRAKGWRRAPEEMVAVVTSTSYKLYLSSVLKKHDVSHVHNLKFSSSHIKTSKKKSEVSHRYVNR